MVSTNKRVISRAGQGLSARGRLAGRARPLARGNTAANLCLLLLPRDIFVAPGSAVFSVLLLESVMRVVPAVIVMVFS